MSKAVGIIKHRAFRFGIQIMVLLLLLFIIGPCNRVHGGKAKSTIEGELPQFLIYDISSQAFTQEFSPKYGYLKGLQLLLLNTGEHNSGDLYISIQDKKENTLYEKSFDVSEIVPGEWVDVDLKCNLKPGRTYRMVFRGINTKENVSAVVINGSLDVDENLVCYRNDSKIEGGMAIGYYYYKTFPIVSRSIVCMAIILYSIFLVITYLNDGKLKSQIQKVVWHEQDLSVKAYVICLSILIILTVIMHGYQISSLPYGINVDEMGMGYDAYCLANYGVDRYLMSWPVYPINWGSGQNALYTFVTAVLIKIFGYSVFILRVPAMCNAFLIWFFGIKIIKMKWNKRYHVILYALLFLLTPQFLILTRYGLESLLMLGLSTLFLYTLLYAVEREKWYCYFIAGVSGGIMLYTYAISYVVTIVFLCITLLYIIRLGKCKIKHIIALGIPLGVIAMPLILEQLIGIFDLEQMQLGIFTIPKMPYRYRGGDVNFKHLPENFWLTLYTIFIGDTTNYASILSVQTFYWFSIPYILVGLIYETFQTLVCIKNKIWNSSVLIVTWFWCMFGMGLLMGGKGPNCFRLNAIYFCTAYLLFSGILCSIRALLQQKRIYIGISTENNNSEHSINISKRFVKISGCMAILLTVVYFSYFINVYFYERNAEYPTLNLSTYEEPLAFLEAQGTEVAERTTYLSDTKGIYTLGTLRPSPYDFSYKNMIDKYLKHVREQVPYEDSYYKNYVITGNEYDMGNIDLNANYILQLNNRDKAIQFEKLGFQVMKTATHYVCYK